MVLEQITNYQFEPSHIAIFFTLIYLEAVLSFDNAAILAAMVRPLPPDQRRKALLYGLAGAYIMRVTAILFVTVIIANPFLKIAGALYLLYLPIKHFWDKRQEQSGKVRAPATLFGLSAFWATVVYVELADLAFALDQVLVAVALATSAAENAIPIIIAASVIAILFLRIAASFMSRLMDWFPMLETLAYLAVGFVGLKLLYEEGLHAADACSAGVLCPVPKEISVGVTLMLLVVPVLVKFVVDGLARRRKAAGE